MKKRLGVVAIALLISTAAYGNCSWLTFITESLPGFYVSEPAYFAIEVWGGTAPYTFQITSGSLPAGLSMSSAGVISGTPTTVDNTTIFVKVTDANGCHLTQAFMVTTD